MTNWTSAHRTRPRPRLDRATGLSWRGVGSRSRVHRLTTRYARRGQIVGRDQCRGVRVGEHRFESNESYSDLHPNPPLLSVAPILLRVEHFLAFRCGEHTHHSPRAGRVTGGPTVHPRESFNRSGGSGQIGGDGAQRSARVADQRAQIPIAEPGSVPRLGRILSTNSTKESAADSKVATASNTIAPLLRTQRRGTSRVTAPLWWIGV